ncbi:hypothetical protein C8R47DRAFT_1069574 [Mycena vitilis]|nr:hypothetical protein C8R47DRAFT_1069574 [Mycena vitilis]
MHGLEGSSLNDPWILRANGQLVLKSKSSPTRPKKTKDLAHRKKVIYSDLGQARNTESLSVAAASNGRAELTSSAGGVIVRQPQRRVSAPPSLPSADNTKPPPLPPAHDVSDQENQRPWSGRKSHRISLKKRYLGCGPPPAPRGSAEAPIFSHCHLCAKVWFGEMVLKCPHCDTVIVDNLPLGYSAPHIRK